MNGASSLSTAPSKRHRSIMRLREHLTGYLFILPSVLLISIFGILSATPST
jgi:hypothetical protein